MPIWNSGEPHDCQYLKVNAAFERQTGLAEEDVIGHTIRDLFAQEEAREIIELYATVVSTQQPTRRTIWFEPARSWYELSVFPTRGDEFTVVIENVTERTVAHQNLAAEEERLRVTLQSVGDAVIVADAAGNVTLMNQVAGRLTGCSRREPLWGRQTTRCCLPQTGTSTRSPTRQPLFATRAVRLPA